MEPPDARSDAACPSWDTLLAYRTGGLAGHAAEAVGVHLAACSRCQATLDGVIEKQGEPLTAGLLEQGETRSSNPLHSMATLAVLTAATESPPVESFLPLTLGQYELVQQIGRGGMGSVYLGVHRRLKMRVAVKLLPPERTRDPRAVARFQREMEAIGRVRHPNIVRATDAGEADGVHFLVMDLIDGIDLSRLVYLLGSLRVADACELIRQAASGLACAHEHGLVHRDIKPSNMMLSRQGTLQILDLGLALLDQGEAQPEHLTQRGQVMGTVDYMAPEQWAACHAVDIRADIYSLGCALHTLLTGRAPFAGPEYSSALRKMAAHAGETPRPLTACRQDIPKGLQVLFERLTAKEPDDRVQTPTEVANALLPFCAGADLPALAREGLAKKEVPTAEEGTRGGGRTLSTLGKAVPSTQRQRDWRRHRGSLLAAFGIALVAVSIGLWFWLSRPDGQPFTQELTPAPVPRTELGRWRNLLVAAPQTRFWVAKFDAYFVHDPMQEILRVQSSHPALIRLGQTNAASYKLQIGFRQVPWVGGLGVYFAGKGDANFRFQLIDMRSFEQKLQSAFTLNRSTGTLWAKPGFTPDVPLRGFASSVLRQPSGGQEQILELLVNRQDLERVFWNGTTCSGLTGTTVKVPEWTDDYRGEFGVYCSGSNVTISTARFLATEE